VISIMAIVLIVKFMKTWPLSVWLFSMNFFSRFDSKQLFDSNTFEKNGIVGIVGEKGASFHKPPNQVNSGKNN